MTTGFPVATTPSPGVQGVDWEARVDFERLRQYRLERTRRALERSELGALLLFETSNIRYVTGTHIGYWAFNKGERYALITAVSSRTCSMRRTRSEATRVSRGRSTRGSGSKPGPLRRSAR